MKIFKDMWDRVFKKGGRDDVPVPTIAPPAAPGAKATTKGPDVSLTSAPGPVPVPIIDVEEVLEALAAAETQKLNWKSSIVDLMKLLDMDSSLAARKELADELGYTGDKGDSAAMNIWLHKEVIRQFAANGGKVPANLLD